ncbi:MAG: urease accessory protein UreD [Sulfuriferula multivorans]|uniref:Urease accessory protein UreD n=1 Tax=Sulfuriferula multivorans TaxID=1559896 RepID=A0A7C9NZH3_9PROT|nr:urease accessory protein UreD [Sulfuriferula multivorans]
MNLAEPFASTWHAHLSLGFEKRETATILARREHVGPLRVQKPLYPEGEAVCHAIVLHPPSGIVGGDELEIDVRVGPGAHALLTTPGASKWYRSAGAWARQRLSLTVDAGGVLEWLPQESIVFDAARAAMSSSIDLHAEARFIGMEVLCLGRRASGEAFANGAVHLGTRVQRAGQPIWLERGQMEGGSGLLNSPAGLAGFSISGTLLVVAPHIKSGLLAACREIPLQEAGARSGLTQLPDMLVARYLGHSSEAARHWFAALWQQLRPALIGRAAQTPRIWNT